MLRPSRTRRTRRAAGPHPSASAPRPCAGSAYVPGRRPPAASAHIPGRRPPVRVRAAPARPRPRRARPSASASRASTGPADRTARGGIPGCPGPIRPDGPNEQPARTRPRRTRPPGPPTSRAAARPSETGLRRTRTAGPGRRLLRAAVLTLSTLALAPSASAGVHAAGTSTATLSASRRTSWSWSCAPTGGPARRTAHSALAARVPGVRAGGDARRSSVGGVGMAPVQACAAARGKPESADRPAQPTGPPPGRTLRQRALHQEKRPNAARPTATRASSHGPAGRSRNARRVSSMPFARPG